MDMGKTCFFIAAMGSINFCTPYSDCKKRELEVDNQQIGTTPQKFAGAGMLRPRKNLRGLAV